MNGEKCKVYGPGFVSLLAAQSFGALNDNAFKVFITLMAAAILPQDKTPQIIAFAGACFILPFILLSPLAGALADRYSKKKIIVTLKAAELGLMGAGAAALYFSHIPAMLALLFLMGAHSALFSPVKLSIVPEIVSDSDISHANGLMSMMTFAGIIIGTAAAGLLSTRYAGAYHGAAWFFLIIAGAGFLSSLAIKNVPASGSFEALPLNPFSKMLGDFREIQRHLTIYRALVASAYFWFIGALFQMNILLYGKQLMQASDSVLSGFQMAVAFGIGCGSIIAGKMSKNRVELGLVPLGAFGLVLFSTALAFSYSSPSRTAALLLLLGLSGGFFVLPLTAFIQQRSPAKERGKFIAAGNVMAFTGVLLASAFLWFCNSVAHLSPAQVFITLAAMTLFVAVYILALLPEFLLRLLVYPVANIIYRIRVKGGDNVPLHSGALLVSNHISFIDAVLLIGASQRPVRFIMHKKYYSLPLVTYLFRLAKCIPISHRGGPHEIADSLQAARNALKDGELVCIFIEGEISRHGQLLRFRKGYERIVSGLDVPVVPVHLDGVWGRLFSFKGGHPIFKWPKQLGYPVTVSFGQPLLSATGPGEIRLAMQELSSEAFRNRLAEKSPLPLSFADMAKKHWWRFSMVDSSGRKLSHGGALVRSCMLSRALKGILPPAHNVGLLLPPSVGGALVNVALSMLGKVPVNLNYTLPYAGIIECADSAGAEKIIVSKKLAEKMGWPVSEKMIFLEDLAAGISRIETMGLGLLLFFSPMFLLRRTLLRAAAGGLDDTAAIIFTSGSTGKPKGVMLSHANIHANIEAMAQIYEMTPSDRLLGVLPFFHSFGFTVTLWLPLVVGFGVLYHNNPLDAQIIGRMARQHRATMLLGTPTFLVSYIRRVEKEQFRWLRLVVSGAEKLREEIAASFREKFGIQPLEGYGCTELSPVAALNIPDYDSDGISQRGGKSGTIGQPLPGTAMKVVAEGSDEPLPSNTPGLLMVKGPNVMKGYLGETAPDPERIRDGYYVTGDIASIDDDGFVTITDRLSRFSKIGGEMVPHIKIEEKLHQLAGELDRTFVVVGAPDPTRGEKLIVFHTRVGNMARVLDGMASAGLPNLWVPRRENYHEIAQLPLLGTGKLDMAGLKRMAAELQTANPA